MPCLRYEMADVFVGWCLNALKAFYGGSPPHTHTHTPPLPFAGVSIVMERGYQQNDSLADGYFQATLTEWQERRARLM